MINIATFHPFDNLLVRKQNYENAKRTNGTEDYDEVTIKMQENGNSSDFTQEKPYNRKSDKSEKLSEDVPKNKYSDISLVSIIRSEGIGGLYQGIQIAVIGSIFFYTTTFFTYRV